RREEDPDDDPQGPPEPVALCRRRVLERTEPVEADHPEAGEDVDERCNEAEEAEDRDEDGGILHPVVLSPSLNGRPELTPIDRAPPGPVARVTVGRSPLPRGSGVDAGSAAHKIRHAASARSRSRRIGHARSAPTLAAMDQTPGPNDG